MTETAVDQGQSVAATVRLLDDAWEEAWDSFVEHHRGGTFFHLSGWRHILENMLGHRTFYLFVERAGVIEGVLPLARVRSLLFGDALISMPFCVYGGICADTPQSHEILRARALDLAEELGTGHLELRNLGEPEPGWRSSDLYVTFRKDIHPDPEQNLMAIPRKQRAMVRKGIKHGLQSAIDDDIERFFDAYSQSLRNLGTPVLPKRYYAALKDTFGERCEVLTVTDNGRLVSSVMSFFFRDEVLPYYGGGGVAARAVKGNDFMYWELMRRSAERGIRVFDYGRSKKGTGSYHFKKNWGFEPSPLNYSYRLVRAKSLPEVNPLNPKYAMFINLWQRLPLSLSRHLGPLIARSLG